MTENTAILSYIGKVTEKIKKKCLKNEKKTDFGEQRIRKVRNFAAF